MAMRAPEPSSTDEYSAGRMEELERENQELREQVRRFAAQQTVARGALTEAASQKEAAVEIAHRVAVEEQATRAAVEVQTSGINFSVVMQIINLCALLIILFGLFVWLPDAVANRVRPAGVVTTAPGTVTTIPR